MLKSKLFLLYVSLEKGKSSVLLDFVQSPFFNKKKLIIKFVIYLVNNTKHQTKYPQRLSKKVIYSYLYPNRDYDEKQMKYLMSELFQLLSRFISIQAFEQNGIMPQYYRMDYFLDKKLENHFQYEMRVAHRILEEMELSGEKCYQRYLLGTLNDKRFQQKGVREYDRNLEGVVDDLDTFYFLKKIRYLCVMMDQERFLPDVSYDKFLIDEMEVILKSEKYPDHPLILIYRLVFLLFRTDDVAFFSQLKKKLWDIIDTLIDTEAKLFLFFGINFCIRKIRSGNNEFANDLMDFYVKGVEGAYLLPNNEISPWTFKNMVQLGIGLKRYQWLEEFIGNYSQFLPVDDQEGASHYNLAQLHYAKGDFEKAFQNLNLIEFSNIHYNIGAKLLLLRMYYEQKEEDALFALLSSFDIYLKRSKKMSGEAKFQYLHFVKVLFQIAKYGNTRKEKIQIGLAKLKVVAERRWLQKMINKL